MSMIVGLPDAICRPPVDRQVHRGEAGEGDTTADPPAGIQPAERHAGRTLLTWPSYLFSGTSFSTEPTTATPASIRP